MSENVVVYVTFRNLSDVLIERVVELDKKQYELIKIMKERGDDKYIASYLEGLADRRKDKQ